MIGRGWGGSTGRAFQALAAFGALAALGGGLAACGGSSAPSTDSATAAAAAGLPAPIGAKATTTTSAAAASKPAGIATPGTKLAVGQTAKVAYTPNDTVGKGGASTLLATVRSVDKGSLSDFNGIQLDASQKASTPYYVRVHVTNLVPGTIDVDGSAAAIEGVDSTGNNQQSVTFIGEFPRCPDRASTMRLGTGAGYDDCLTFMVPGGISKVSYNGTDNYIDSPVTWAPN